MKFTYYFINFLPSSVWAAVNHLIGSVGYFTLTPLSYCSHASYIHKLIMILNHHTDDPGLFVSVSVRPRLRGIHIWYRCAKVRLPPWSRVARSILISARELLIRTTDLGILCVYWSSLWHADRDTHNPGSLHHTCLDGTKVAWIGIPRDTNCWRAWRGEDWSDHTRWMLVSRIPENHCEIINIPNTMAGILKGWLS